MANYNTPTNGTTTGTTTRMQQLKNTITIKHVDSYTSISRCIAPTVHLVQ